MKARTNAQMLYTIVALGLALGLLGRLILQIDPPASRVSAETLRWVSLSTPPGC